MADIFFTLLNRMDFTVFDKRHLTFKTHMLNGRFINSPEHTFCVFLPITAIAKLPMLEDWIIMIGKTSRIYYLYHCVYKNDYIKLWSFTLFQGTSLNWHYVKRPGKGSRFLMLLWEATKLEYLLKWKSHWRIYLITWFFNNTH